MFIEFADVVEQRGNLPDQQLGVLRERKSLVVALVVGFIEIGSMQMREKIISVQTVILKDCWVCLTTAVPYLSNRGFLIGIPPS